MSPSSAVLVANGPVVWNEQLAAVAAAADPLLAADGGADHLARIGLRPKLVVGDLDSISPGVRRWLGEDRMVPRPDQDRTDLDKALGVALDELGLGSLTVLGAVGGRIDHAVANLGLLARRAVGERLRFVAPDHRIVAVKDRCELASAAGETWSFFTFDPGVRVDLDGVRWPVTAAVLDPAGQPSISNLAIGDRVVVGAEGGAVVVVRYVGL